MRIITEDGRWGSWVVEWLARYLSDPTRIERDHGHLLSRDGKRVIVNPEAVIDTFNAVLKNKQPPQSAEISNALRSLSTGVLVPFPSGDRTGFEVLVKEIAAWSAEKSIGTPGAILANANSTRGAKGNNVIPMGGAYKGDKK
jgi:hypothetical protein